MDAPRDIKDRIAKRLLRHPRMVRDMLGFVPAEWLADVRPDTVRELPAEYIGARGDRRVGDLLLLADRDGGRRLLLMVEHQSAPGPRMAARMAGQTGLLYESLGSALRVGGRFPALLAVVVHAGAAAWREAADLADVVEASAVPGVSGPSYLLLDLRRIARDDPGHGNRFGLLARLTWADSVGEAARLLMGARSWLDLADEEEQDLFRDYAAWLYALEPDGFPPDWNPHERRSMEELMGQLSPLQINHRRETARLREQHLAEGRAEGTAHERAMLARLAARRFGAVVGRRLGTALREVSDPVELDRIGDLIVDCATGEELLDGLNGAAPRA
jgi:hypothetical protein